MTATTVLADSLPAGLVRDATLVVGGAVVTGVLSQVVVPLPFTPVPLSLGTFAVLLVGAVCAFAMRGGRPGHELPGASTQATPTVGVAGPPAA